MPLIIVESPTKARTFNRILKSQKKDDYYVFATVGHIRDLPSKNIAIDYTKQFKPKYEVIAKKKNVVDKMKELAAQNKEIILATDLDREGEAISYHIAYLLGFVKENWPTSIIEEGKLKRIVFHEITPKALTEALANPSTLRLDLVNAQQARRILDRVVGYELSPLLWKKTGKNWLSAGRVQTVALRFIVEREKEIRAFKKEPYFQVYGFFKAQTELKAKLIAKNEEPYEKETTIQLFAGPYTFVKTSISQDNLTGLKSDVESDSYEITDIEETVTKRYPPPPFTTSLLQQEAFQKLRLPSSFVMRLAQQLYERGLITYHRTDSFALSTNFVFRAKDYIEANYGKEYALEKPRGYKTRSRSAQEAHEAIRPTRVDKSIDEQFEGKKLSPQHKKLYELIHARAIATQMKEAEVKNIKVILKGENGYTFESVFQKVLFDGFLKVLNPKFVEDHQVEPKFEKGKKLDLVRLDEEQKETQPPYRYHDGSLIKELEEKGIGRPSTYAMIISLIQTKGYVEKEFRYFKPTLLGEGICDYLSSSFSKIFDTGFTARMEEGLDEVAEGKEDMIKLLTEFYDPFKSELDVRSQETGTLDIKDEEIEEKCPLCGSDLVRKVSKFGRFLACSTYPKCKFTKSELKVVKGKKCPKDGGDIVTRFTKSKKRFFGCSNYPKCDFAAWTFKDLQ